MKRNILRSLCSTVWVFAAAAQAFAVWPPVTSLDGESEVSSAGVRGRQLSPVLHRDVQAVTTKLEQDERRLEKVIQDLKDDEAALKKLSKEGLDAHGGTHQ